MSAPAVRTRLAAHLPRPLVDAYRWLRLAFPMPAGDRAGDLRDLLRRRTRRLPPAGLRQKVGRTPARSEYLASGAGAAAQVLEALAPWLPPAPGEWLDFGCGCGRLARHLTTAPGCARLTGVDVDLDSVRWCERHLPGRFLAIAPRPPLPLAAETFGVAIAASVFTHLDEAGERAWLLELRRVLRPGGLLVASTHGAELHVERAELGDAGRERLRSTGFAFVPPDGHFNTGTAYHSRAYVERVWGGLLTPLAWFARGLFGTQDLSVWRREPA